MFRITLIIIAFFNISFESFSEDRINPTPYLKLLESAKGPGAKWRRQAFSAFVGKEYPLNVEKLKSAEAETAINIKEFEPIDAIQAIVQHAKNTRVVILNEAHHVSFHRVFALEVAKALKKIGYSYVSLEAFVPKDLDKFVLSGVPSSNLGINIMDPEYSNFLRLSHELGYKFLAHNQWENRPHYNSIREAQELGPAEKVRELLINDSDAKVFIVVSSDRAKEFGYISDDEQSNNTAWFAEHLRTILNEDILTIDQVSGTKGLSSTSNLFDLLSPKLTLDTTAFQNTSGGFMVSDEYLDTVDMTIFHPEEITHVSESGRPVWLSKQKHLKEIEINLSEYKDQFPLLVQAYLSKELDHEYGAEVSLPVDQFFLETDHSSSLNMYLLPGHYTILLENKDGTRFVFNQNITVRN
jgi:hypothetical protein